MNEDGTLSMNKLTAEEREAMVIDTGWRQRYDRAISKTFGNQWNRLLDSLEGRELKEAIDKMTDITYDFRYNFKYDENKLKNKE